MRQVKIFDKYILFENGDILSVYSGKKMSHRIRHNKACVSLRNGKPKNYYIHDLIAFNFIRNFDSLKEYVSFKDNNTLNFNIDNLTIDSIIPTDNKELKSVKVFNDYLLFENGTIFSIKINKMLSGYTSPDGVITFTLNNQTVLLHNLMGTHFLKDYDPLNDLISFKDGNKSNCHIDNLIVRKLAYITQKNDAQSTAFFESQNPYKLAKIYLSKFIKRKGGIFYNSIFGNDDFIQLMVMELYKATPTYLLKYALGNDTQEPVKYNTFAHNIFENMFNNFNSIWIEMYKFDSVVEVENIFMAEYNAPAISIVEAIEARIFESND